MEQLYGFVVCKFGLLVHQSFVVVSRGGMGVDGGMEHRSTDRTLGSPQNLYFLIVFASYPSVFVFEPWSFS